VHQMSGLYSGASVAPTSDVLAMTSSGTIFMPSLVTSPYRENYYRRRTIRFAVAALKFLVTKWWQ
jgi:hypothetical protein